MGHPSLTELPPSARVAYALGVLLIPAMVLELLTLVPAVTSTALTAAFLAVSAARGAGVMISGVLTVHLGMLAYFIGIAIAQASWGAGGAMRSDVLNALQGMLAAPVLAALLAEYRGLRTRYLADTARVLVLLGVAATLGGVYKLYAMTRGRFLESLFLADGRYPPGAALQHDYNLFALGLLVCLGFALQLYQKGPGVWGRVGATLAVPVLTIGITLSNSRRGFVFLCLLLGYALMGRSNLARRGRLGLVVPVVAACLAGLLLYGAYASGGAPILEWARSYIDLRGVTQRLGDVVDSERLLATRAPLLAFGWHDLASAASVGGVVLGHGTQYLSVMGNVFHSPAGIEYPHNLLLSALLHGGILLAVPMVGLLLAGLLAAWRLRREAPGLTGAFVVSLGVGLTSSVSLYSHELLYFLLLSLGLPGSWGTESGRNRGEPECGPRASRADGRDPC